MTTRPPDWLKCGRCHWLEVRHDLNTDKGACRRHAPHPAERADALAWWPLVAYEDWCGEWQRADEHTNSTEEPRVAASGDEQPTKDERGVSGPAVFVRCAWLNCDKAAGIDCAGLCAYHRRLVLVARAERSAVRMDDADRTVERGL